MSLFAVSLLACSGEDPGRTETSALPSAELSRAEQANDFDRQMEEVAQAYFLLRPEIATYLGVPDIKAGEGASSRFGSYSPVGEAQRRAGLKDMLERLAAIDRSDLMPGQRVSLELVETSATNAYAPSQVVGWGTVLCEYGSWFSPYPVSHLSGPHTEIPMLLESKMAVRNSADAEAWMTRLETYASVLDEVIDKVHHDRELGVVPPDFVIDRTLGNLGNFVGQPPAKHSLVAALNKKLADAGVGEAENYTVRAAQLLESAVFPATRRLMQTLQELKPLASHEPGVGRLPDGPAYYQAMITHMTDTTLEPGEIHAIGLHEVSRIHAEMDDLLQQIGLREGTVGARMAVMLQDPQYLFPNTPEGKAQLMASLQADLALADEKLPQWFGKLPDQEVEIRAVPPHREQSVTGAFYDPPSVDGSRPGTYWISLADTAAIPSYSLQTLTYHEANPGHHLQTIIGLDDSLPILNTVFYSNAAGEGWGLYAEYLASEMGVYENDPVDDLGRLQAELHRAVRLVVDTGMHALGWSRERAIEYSVENEGIHIDEAIAEIERYAVWPGQALGYKLGMLKILELRERARKALGDSFDIRLFHDAVLEEGALPLNLLEAKIDAWIMLQSS
jgi:uncharacterized protein (DUF885 family)